MNYKRIYISLIKEVNPDLLKNSRVQWILNNLSSFIYVIELNDILFNNNCKNKSLLDSRLRSYKVDDIIMILKYQKNNNLTNSDIIKRYGISRTTLFNWRKRFVDVI